LQGARKIGKTNCRDINLMDFERNDVVFDRNKDENILISTPNIVCRIDYNDLYEEHMDWNADVTLVGTLCDISADGNGSECIHMNVDESSGKVLEMTIGQRPNSTHQYSGKLLVKRETMLNIMHLAPELGEYEMLTLIMEMFDSLDVRCHTFDGYLRRINTIQDYFKTNLELIDTEISCELFYGDKIIYTKIKDNHPTLYKDSSCVKHSCVASGSVLHGEIENSVLFRQIVQGKGSKIKNSILMEGCRVGEGTRLEYVVADRNVTIGDNVVLKGTKDSPVVLKKEMVI
jgi:glucose-1-phosphate adenylyltransferase